MAREPVRKLRSHQQDEVLDRWLPLKNGNPFFFLFLCERAHYCFKRGQPGIPPPPPLCWRCFFSRPTGMPLGNLTAFAVLVFRASEEKKSCQPLRVVHSIAWNEQGPVRFLFLQVLPILNFSKVSSFQVDQVAWRTAPLSRRRLVKV